MTTSLPHTLGSSHTIPAAGTGTQTHLIHDEALRAFLTAFLAAGGIFSPRISLTSIETQGNCCVANDDIDEGTELFRIPRDILFNTTTCQLGSLCRQKEQKSHRDEAKDDNDMSIDEEPSTSSSSYDKKWDQLTGWTPLIISLMWASVQSQDQSATNSPKDVTNALWSAYFAVLPIDFSHLPMFWPEADLRELGGTSIPERIGKEEADEEYHSVVVPFITSRPEIFFPGQENLSRDQIQAKVQQFYSLDHFHIQGSRILSRSFHVKKQGTREVREGRMVDMDESADVADGESEGSESEEDDEEEREDTGDISMVPMADMLNASYGSENARLFYTSTALSMRAVCPIKRGEQILNTYGDPPNSDLLRRYGHVDVVNGSDEVELTARLLVEASLRLSDSAVDLVGDAPSNSASSEAQREALTKRVEHCIAHAGLEESYVLSYIIPPNPQDSTSPRGITDLTAAEVTSLIQEGRCNFFEDEELQSLCRALLMDTSEWQMKYETKTKVPKAKMSVQVAELLELACVLRKEMYPTEQGHEEDEDAAAATMAAPEQQQQSTSAPLSLNARNAAVVRRGEKAVLRQNREVLQRWLKLQQQQSQKGNGDRTNGTSSDGTQKKKRKELVSSGSNGTNVDTMARRSEGGGGGEREEAGKRKKR